MGNRDEAVQDTITDIDAWLPQTQCTKCGYPRCRDYAAAIMDGRADINQCPPGGDITIRGLAALTGKIGKPLNPEFGVHAGPTVARIEEETCIGCVMCIKACPVDAIVGAAKLMHTVVPSLCTGCELCVEPCPVDCISMLPTQPDASPDWRWPDYSPEQTATARSATCQRLERLERRAQEKSSAKKLREFRHTHGSSKIREEIRAAVARQQATKKTAGPES